MLRNLSPVRQKVALSESNLNSHSALLFRGSAASFTSALLHSSQFALQEASLSSQGRTRTSPVISHSSLHASNLNITVDSSSQFISFLSFFFLLNSCRNIAKHREVEKKRSHLFASSSLWLRYKTGAAQGSQ